MACKKKKRGKKRTKKRRTEEKKEDERRKSGREDVGKYGYFTIVIHRARISNYNDGQSGGGKGRKVPARLSVLGCAKNSRDEDEIVDGAAAWLSVFSARIERRQ